MKKYILLNKGSNVSELCVINRENPVCIKISKKALSKLGLSNKDRLGFSFILINQALENIITAKELLCFERFNLIEDRNKNCLEIYVWNDNEMNSDLDLFKRVVDKYLCVIFSEKTLVSAYNIFKSTANLDKVILEEKVKVSVLPIKKFKI